MSFEKTSNPLYSQFIHLSRYSRWNPKTLRRETWEETIHRLSNFWLNKFPEYYREFQGVFGSVYNLDVMPSMRSLMTAGEALDRDNVAGYNCSYLPITGSGGSLSIYTDEMKNAGFEDPITIQLKEPKAFDELMYILLCGTGVGFSVERQYISNLPTVNKPLDRNIYKKTNKNYPRVNPTELSFFDKKKNKIIVADSKYGWASALRILIVELYNGNFEIGYDTSKVRAKGELLKTFGGRASGPEPLMELFEYIINVFKTANGRKLTSIECHGIVCKIASVIVVGGVRRSALISLSNLSDDRIRHAKSGEWWIEHPEYALANNSVAYTEKPNMEAFIREWTALIESKSGERGIFNRTSAERKVVESGRRKSGYHWGTNP